MNTADTMKPFCIFVEYQDLFGEAYESTFWTLMKKEEFAHLRHGDLCFLKDDFHHYCIVEFEFYSERALNVFKLKHPNEYQIIMSNHDLYEENKHRIRFTRPSQ